MPIPPWLSATLSLVALVACKPDEPEDGTSDDAPTIVDTSTSTTDTAPTTTTTPPIPWPYPLPWLEGVEWVPGLETWLTLENIPPGADVVFRWSFKGFENLPCDNPGPDGCLGLIDPVDLGTAVADADSYARWSALVDSMGELPDTLYFQAHVTDPVTGASTLSSAIQRNVSVPEGLARSTFRDVTGMARLADVFTSGNSHTGGLSWPDYNGDHFPDLWVANGGGIDHRLFRNNGNGTFTDVSQSVRKPRPGLETAATHFADVDNDGDVDLFAVVDSAVEMKTESVQPFEGGPNLLYINQGDGTFVEEALERGLVDPRGWRTISAAWADFNADGFIDVHLSTWAMNQLAPGRDSRLLLNDGTGHFVEEGPTLGYGRDVLTTLAADLDLDGLPDLYMGHVNDITGFHGSNPIADDVIYRNSPTGFIDVTASSSGLGDDAWAAMGLDIGDLDNDGDFDIYVTDRWEADDPLPRGNPLYLQQPDGSFSDNVCDKAGICTSYAGWATFFADFDRDGWSDLYVATAKEWFPDLIYLNDGDGTFTSHWSGAMRESPVRGGAQADFDGDGAVDFAVWQYNDDMRLFRNNAIDSGHWLEVELVGTNGDPLALGATVRALGTDGVNQLRRVSGGDSSHSQSSNILHFGLGSRTEPIDLDIIWPGGATQRVEDVPVDGFYLIDANGVMPQAIIEGRAILDEPAGTVTVKVQARYGGRASLSVVGGDLQWNVEENTHIGTFPVTTPPNKVVVTDNLFGQTFDVPVR